MSGFDPAFEPLGVLAAGIRSGRWGPVRLAEGFLERIAALDPRLHAFVQLTAERALAAARAAEGAWKDGRDLGPLHGLPCAVKDLFDVKGVATGAGTRLRQGHRAVADCRAVAGLDAAGMVLLGKTHTVQFALGAVGVNHDLGTPLNPWQAIPHIPGGSSSGSAVAVAAGLVPVALGTDTGGSVRIPAALCSLVGLKPTVGRISRAGVYPLSWNLDSVGVLARRVEDAAWVYQALEGPDAADPSTLRAPAPADLRGLREGVRGLRIAFGESVFFDEVDPQVEQAVRETGAVFQALGARVERLAVPEVARAHAHPLRPKMVGIDGAAANAAYLDGHPAALDPVVTQRLLAGRAVSAPEYSALLRLREELQQSVQRTLAEVDLLLAPTTQLPARPLAEVDRSLESYLEFNGRYNRNTGLGNFLNLCAISVPCGFTREGLPIGLMIQAKPFQENMLFRAALAYEQATQWKARCPDLAWASSGRS